MITRSRKLLTGAALVAMLAIGYGAAPGGAAPHADAFADALDLLIDAAGSLPADPSNRHADDSAAADLGHRLFFDTRLSANGRVSCATCHDPARNFQDGIALAKGVGVTQRRTMPIAGTAYSP